MNNQFSIIIPTMWVPDTFETLLSQLINEPIIKEIIIINNKKDKTPNWQSLYHYKVNLINQEKNIYVNPAWNLGVSLASCNNICLLNDDILFNTSIFEMISPQINTASGLIGLNMLGPQSETITLTREESRCWGFGCLMIMHKDNYHIIPNDLRILYGDDYLFAKNKPNTWYINGLANNRVAGTTCCSDYNTSNPDLPEISRMEHEWFHKFTNGVIK